MPIIQIAITDQEAALLKASIATPDDADPKLAPYLEALVRDHVLSPMLERDRQARVARVLARVDGLVDQLAALDDAQQDEIQALVTRAVASATASKGGGVVLTAQAGADSV